MTKAYDEPHIFWVYNIDDGYNKWKVVDNKPFQAINWGPVFPYFLGINFNNYESFRWFTNLYGIGGFARFHKAYEPLGRTLKKRREKPAVLTKTYLERVWKEIKDSMTKEQAAMAGFYHAFVRPWKELPGELIKYSEEIAESLLVANSHLKDVYHQAPLPSTVKRIQRALEWPLEDYLTKTVVPEIRRRKTQKIPPPMLEVHIEHRYRSIIARCYMELVELVRDNKVLNYCQNCNWGFVTDKLNEKYCNRLDPDAIKKYNYPSTLISAPLPAWIKKAPTCKREGALKQWRKNLTDEQATFVKEKKRKLSHLYYLRDRSKEGKLPEQEYLKAKDEFGKWVRKNQPKKKSSKQGEVINGK